MKCHYEVLQISRTADESEIKNAYKKLALKWHPDKNLENSEEAKAQFQLIQQAYEILSDRQERAWYDNHREQILRSNDKDFVDNVFDVFPYFTTTCFRGYRDDENGFYAVYRNVFEKIAQEDMEFMEDKEELYQIPSFGISSSDYIEVVVPFYSFWMAYKTKKSFVWLDPFGINEARSRRDYKFFEKKNKKIRQQAQKERNDEVRALVEFVRKRDKRVQEYNKKLQAKIIENRQKQEDISRQKRMERRKELYEIRPQAEWCDFDNLASELDEIERNWSTMLGETEECSTVDLYCITCNKVFKTKNSFKNHELSKKHKLNLQQAQIEEEEMFYINSDENSEDGYETVEEEVIAEQLEDVIVKELEEASSEKIKKEVTTGQVVEENIGNEDEELVSDSNYEEIELKLSKKKQKRQSLMKDETDFVEIDTNSSIFESDDMENYQSKKQKRKNKTNLKNNVTKNLDADKSCDETHTTNIQFQTTKKIKNRKCRQNELETEIDCSRCCVVCKTYFSSKNKLFEHLKTTGHSVYISETMKKQKQIHVKK